MGWKTLKMDSGTGWKEIYREAGTGWKALTFEDVPIDVGGACIDRNDSHSGSYTRISMTNPANASGTLTNVCIYVYSVGAGNVHVGTFHNDLGLVYTCKSVVNVGVLTPAGAHNKAISLAIAEGDYIGIYGSGARWEASLGVGYLYHSGNCVVLDQQNTFGIPGNDYIISVYGTG